MSYRFRTLIVASAIAAIACVAGNASAGTLAENSCSAAIGKTVTKYQATIAKNMVACHKAKAGGKLDNDSRNCNDADSSDVKGKVPGARQKVADGITAKCNDADALAVRQLYPTCPSPAENADGINGIDNFGELASCLIELSDAYVGGMAEQVLGQVQGAVTGVPINTALAECQNGIGKAFSKAVKTYGSTYAKSQAAYNKLNLTSGANLAYGVRVSGDPDGKASTAILAVKDAITEGCGLVAPPNPADLSGPAWDDLGMCGQSTPEQDSCATGILNRQLSGLTGAVFHFPNTAGVLQCASFADIFVNAGAGSHVTRTRLDTGYTGAAHREDVLDQSIIGVKLENCDDNCANCDVRIDPTNAFCRCDNNPSIVCDDVPTIAGESTSTECGGNLCHCMFGPPQPLSSGGTPICMVNRFAREFTGGTTTAGSYDVGTRIRSYVFTGINALRPCPTCEGDSTLNDGVKGGLCKYADEDPPAGACDANAAITLGNISNIVSFDCMPESGGGIGTQSLGLQFTDGTKSLTAAITTGSGFCTAGTCHCSQCTADPTVGCATTADCTAAGLGGTCGQNLAGSNPRQNSCTAGVSDCAADGLNPGMGTCTSGPFDKFCDGTLRANGAGVIPCSSDASCDVYDSICDGGDCGICTSSLPHSQRSCFLPTIFVTGESGVYDGEAVSVGCSAQTGSPSVNAARGLPGPVRVRLDFNMDLLCDDHSTSYELPGGMNCP